MNGNGFLIAMDKWFLNLKVGDVVCDCRFKHQKIVEIIQYEHPESRDVVLEDGMHCGEQCLDPVDTHTEVDHPNWKREENGEIRFV